MKIAYCIPGLCNPSGMERVLTLKANYLVAHGYDVHVILTDGAGRPFAFPLDERVKVHQLDIDFEEPYHHPFLRRVWLYRQKMRLLRKRLDQCLCEVKPDITVSLLRRDINVIHSMTDGSLKMGEIHFDRLHYRNFVAPRWLPTVVADWIKRRWMSSLIGNLKRLAKFVVLSHEDAAYWPELNNVVVIPNPSSFAPVRQSDCMQRQVIAAGRYVGQKGFERLIAAWQMVAEKHPGWKLKIYGDGWMRKQLEQQVADLKLQDSCFLEHSVPDIENKMLESSIFVLSSRYEGFCLVIVEAMSCGLPVVSFACHCGTRDIISDGVDGYLVEEGDIAGLAEKINLLIEDDEKRQKMGRMARLKSGSYSMERIGAQWMELFESLIQKKE